MTPLEVIAYALDHPKVYPDDRFEAFGLDSLDFLEFLLQVQAALNINIPDSRIAELNTVGDLLKVIDELHLPA